MRSSPRFEYGHVAWETLCRWTTGGAGTARCAAARPLWPKSARLALETVNGRVQVDGAFAGVKAETTNGGVYGEGLGSSVVASTTNGEIKLQMASLGGDGVSLETTNGSIDVKLPGNAKGTLSARCVNGGIKVTDLPFEKSGEASRRKLDGTINGGGPALRLETVNGSIRVGGVL